MKTVEELKKTFTSLCKEPFRYEPMGQEIRDKENNQILDIRGWGRLGYMKDGDRLQDEIGEYICHLLNEGSK